MDERESSAVPALTLTARLLEWYDENHRPLPWRERPDPYTIWVSEIMLQQTRSETVERYYEPFLSRFPTVEKLAAASEEEVLTAWSGLGYYRRARQLHAAARLVAAAGGRLPADVVELRRLPGVGPYTAAAIGSLAFGLPEPVLDGNVERVLTRFGAVAEEPRRAAGKRRLLEMARELLDPERPGDFNQAMMELGAQVCAPRNALCGECPLSVECRAREEGEPERYPRTSARAGPIKERHLAVVVQRGSEVLLARRGSDERLLAGMWEVPMIETEAGAPEAALAVRYGGDWTVGTSRGRVRHSITTRALEVGVHDGRWQPGHVGESSRLAWMALSELASIPTTSLVGKILALART